MGDLLAVLALLFDTATSVQRFVDTFIYVYILLIFAYILTSLVRLPYRPWLNRLQRFLYDVCDPYLRIFRRFIPPVGPLDLSPMVAVDQPDRAAADPRLPDPGSPLGRSGRWRSHLSRSGTSSSRRDSAATAQPPWSACSRTSRRTSRRSGASEPISRTRSSSSRSDLQRHRELEGLLRSTLVSAERSAQELKDQARRDADSIVAEAHGEARAVTRRAAAERERLDREVRRITSLLRSALEGVEDAGIDAREPVGESTGEIRRLIS